MPYTLPRRTRPKGEQPPLQAAYQSSASKTRLLVGPEADSAIIAVPSHPQTNHGSIKVLPLKLNQKTTGLSKQKLAILTKKQHWLRDHTVNIPDELTAQTEAVERAVNSTLIFADEYAGTAVCISPGGHVLTCAHCVEEVDKDEDDEEEATGERFKWLLTYDGRAVKTQVDEQSIDHKRDLALMNIVAIQPPTTASSAPLSSHSQSLSVPPLPVSARPPANRAALLCVGQPGPLDLEASDGESPRATGFDILHVSSGVFRGCAKGQDRQDNSEIGALKHDCWTYWGHSGAPLVALKGNRRGEKPEEVAVGLIGVHSSWDDTTGMRRGVSWEAVVEFLKEFGPGRLPLEGPGKEVEKAKGRTEIIRKCTVEVVDLTQDSDS